MKKKFLVIMVLTLTLCFSGAVISKAASINLSGVSAYVEPFFLPGDGIGIMNTSDSGVQISAVTIDLITPLFFDTTPLPPGMLTPFPFTPIFGTLATGLIGPSVTVVDGGASLSMSFTDFDPGEVFAWGIDVDQPSGPFVTGTEFAGSTISMTFEGAFPTTTLSSTYEPFPIFPDDIVAIAYINGEPVPEPATITLLGIGLAGFAGAEVRRRRKKKAVDNR